MKWLIWAVNMNPPNHHGPDMGSKLHNFWLFIFNHNTELLPLPAMPLHTNVVRLCYFLDEGLYYLEMITLCTYIHTVLDYITNSN